MGLILAIDKVNTAIGKLAGWTILILTLAISYEVFARYVLRAPTEWAFDVSYILYGTLFMLAGPYALARNAHVRGDFLYRQWAPRTQARLDLALYLLFFFPGIIALAWAGYKFAAFSWMIGEHSSNSPNGPPLYHFKSLIPIAGVLMTVQGLAEVARCVICLRTGEWPPRLHDVEETEKLILEQAAAAQGAPDAGKAI
ncbi:MAG: TRAP transporter small permease subunit [Bosea sp.]|uniref:TRAP transporter small permease subunit n=1 Tax=Bosea sp. (in: a-proteobacteria) TaxID=1871050 RepID=UPI001ACF443E|nr:TRAP transporter small permease subunit [Bosea sp. (in: a-proteobacteria)]MBN9471036.1 TRAP transporter small permease subunit [Bosea sp. (in: a-proteobacteria)]